MKWALAALVGIALLAIWFITANFGRRDVIWEIPANQAEFEVTFEHWPEPDCPPLPSDPNHIIISIPPSGRRCTSSSGEELRKLRTYRFIVVAADGTRTELPRDSAEYQRLLRSMTGDRTIFFNVYGEPGRSMIHRTPTVSP